MIGSRLVASTAPTIVILAAVLAVLGIALVFVGFGLLRRTRRDPAALGPLEEMGERTWWDADAARRAELLERARPEGAEPVAPATTAPEPFVPEVVAAAAVAEASEVDDVAQVDDAVVAADDVAAEVADVAEVATALDADAGVVEADEDAPVGEVAEDGTVEPEPEAPAPQEPAPAQHDVIEPVVETEIDADTDADAQWMPPPGVAGSTLTTTGGEAVEHEAVRRDDQVQDPGEAPTAK